MARRRTVETEAEKSLEDLVKAKRKELDAQAHAIFEKALADLAALGYELDPGVQVFGSGRTQQVVDLVYKGKR